MKARAAARKQRDKWKMKRWYTIRAPRHPWDFKQIGETIGESDEHIMGRVYEMTLQEFNGDFTKMHIILRFRVTEVVGRDALTTFIGHHHQTDHTRRQIRRYRGKVDDVVDVVSTDGYLVRLKPLIITQKRVQTSVKQAMRSKAAEVIRAFASKNTFSKIQESILGGELEVEILNGVKPIYPVKSVAIHKSQLLQEGVTNEKGPTLDDIHADEARQEAELKAKKAAAIAAAMDGEEAEEEVAEAPSILDAAEALEPASEKTEAAPAEEEVVEEVVEEVPETTNEKTNVQDETPELNFSNLYERMEAINKQMKDLDRERRNIFKQLSRVHTKEVKAARKNRRSGNSNRGSKEPSGFNRPQPVPKEFTVEPWNCDKDEELPRTVLTKKVYDYVKGKGLQDPADKRIIHPDSTLKKLFHLKKGQNIEFKTFQTFMARLYKGETVSEGEGDEEDFGEEY